MIAQSCNKSFLESFFEAIFDSDNNNDSHIVSSSNINPRNNSHSLIPRKRTRNFEARVGVGFIVPINKIGYAPPGFDLGLYTRVLSSKNLYLGGSMAFHMYGYSQIDTLFADYDKIRNESHIFELNLNLKYRFISSRNFDAFVGVHAGRSFFSTKTYAQDNTCDCDGNTSPDLRLKTFRNNKPNYGVTLNLQFPIENKYERLFLDFVYQSPGELTYVEKDGIEIRPRRVTYSMTDGNWKNVTFRIGYSHYF